MIGFGVFTTLAMFLQVFAYRAAEAGLIAPFKYSSMIWSIVLGYVLWGFVPTAVMLLGIAIVVASGLFIVQREIMLKRRVATVKPAGVNEPTR
jgi:drug/metabolite transporter (DMT)-like permease